MAPAAHAAKKKAPSTKTLDKRLKKTDKRVATARKSLSKLSADLGGLSKRLTTTEGSLKTLTDAAPQLVSGLQTLAGVVQNQIAPGLLQLKDALETKVQPALLQLQTGITDVATSQEYGVVNVSVGGVAFAPLGLTSSDIPDDGNSAQASGELPLVVGNGTGGTVPAGATMSLRASIRSGESDGKSTTGDPAGYVGGLLTLKCAGSSADGKCDLDGNPATVVDQVPAGQLVCSVGPSASTSIPLPDSTTLNAFVQKIQLATGRTDRSKPTQATDDSTVNPLQGATVGAGNGPLADGTAFGCKVGGRAGDLYSLNAQSQFLDPPTSLKPGATD